MPILSLITYAPLLGVAGILALRLFGRADDPKSVAPVDIVLFAVKLWDTEKAGELIRPIVGADTRVITLQNGVDSVERLAPILGADSVVGGMAYIATVISSPGVITQTSEFAQMRCGRVDGKHDQKLAAFADAAKKANVDISLTDTVDVDRWKKFDAAHQAKARAELERIRDTDALSRDVAEIVTKARAGRKW